MWACGSAGTLKCLSCRRTVPSSKTDPNDGPALCEDCAAEVSVNSCSLICVRAWIVPLTKM